MVHLPSLGMANGYQQEIGRQKQRLVWCSQVHHSGFSSRRPGFESRHEHQNELRSYQPRSLYLCYICQTYHEWVLMLGVMQIKVSTLVGKENNLPGIKLLELFDKIEFLKQFNPAGDVSFFLLKGSYKNRKTFEKFKKNEALEVVERFEVTDSYAIFSAHLDGPVIQMMSMFENAWPISPTSLDSEQFILTIQGGATGLSNSRKKLIDIFGDSFQISINNNFQGQWDTAPGLPRRRKEVLETAIQMGYYNAPRKCRQRDIADSIGLKQGTVAEHLQIAESLIINAWFHQSGSTGK